MLLRFDANRLNLDVLVGVSEEYSPTEEYTQINDKVQKVKKELKAHMKKLFKKEEIAEIQKMLKGDKGLEQKWSKYLNGTHLPKVKKLKDEIDLLNKELQE